MDIAFTSRVYSPGSFSSAELEQLASAHNYMEVPKNTSLLEIGSIAGENYVVESGLIRSFTFDYKGNDVTTHFFCPGEIAINSLSFFGKTPSEENMQTLTDCKLWCIDFARVQELYHTLPAFREWGRAWMTKELFLSQQRSLNMITLNADARYTKLLSERSAVIHFAPLKYIATYLGITDATLSRLRKKLSETQ